MGGVRGVGYDPFEVPNAESVIYLQTSKEPVLSYIQVVSGIVEEAFARRDAAEIINRVE